jgi:hypothetical protein
VKLEPPKLEAPRPEPPKPEKHDRFRDRAPVRALRCLASPRSAPRRSRSARRGRPPEPDVELATRGRRFVSEMVPVVAAQASADLAGPLDLAATAARRPGRARTPTRRTPAGVPRRSSPRRRPERAPRARALRAAREAYAAGRTTEAVEQD